MWRAPRPFPLVPVAVGALCILLAVLATLQYRWAGALGEAEHARLRASARTRAEAMGREFDAAVTTAFRSLEMTGAEVRSRETLGWTGRYDTWRRTAPWPELVRTVYRVDATGPVPRMERYDPDARAFASVAQAPELQPLLARFPAAPGRGRGVEPIVEEIPALVMLAWGSGDGREPPRGPGPPESAPFVVAVLDLDAIRGRILPALSERYFGGAAGLDQDVRVVRSAGPGGTVWSSSPEAARSARSDAQTGILELRTEGGASRPRPGFPARAFGEDSGRWRLVVANRAGPLDEVVAAARRRNLAVAFGILLLLVATVLLVVFAAVRAQRLGERQMQFVAAVSHELRTPVAVIQSTSENLADGVVKSLDQMRVYGGVIRDESRRLGGMVEDVLAFAGVTSHGRTHREDELDVARLVEDVLGALGSTLRERGFTVEREVAPDLPCVRGDAAQLRRALSNLVENAVKYDGGRCWIAVRASLDPERREVVVSVTDRGRGIAAADLPSVFEPFYRGRDAHERQVRGFGLGLALVRRTAQDHGGSASAVSTPGLGSTFTLRLPAVRRTALPLENASVDLPTAPV
ncbi:MAG: HAMP domain-containing sensor histidine kinase [Vicinamibacteria bacterium]